MEALKGKAPSSENFTKFRGPSLVSSVQLQHSTLSSLQDPLPAMFAASTISTLHNMNITHYNMNITTLNLQDSVPCDVRLPQHHLLVLLSHHGRPAVQAAVDILSSKI